MNRLLGGLFSLGIFAIAFSAIPFHSTAPAENTRIIVEQQPISSPVVSQKALPETTEEFVLHVETPDSVKAVYMTGWSAGTQMRLAHILDLFDGGVLNAVVIDIKDATGKLSYQPIDLLLQKEGIGTHRIKNLKKLIDTLHAKHIYVIGRISVFQDPFYAMQHPEETYQNTLTHTTWVDYKGIPWLRPDSEAVRAYVVRIAQDAYAQGFDEINVDYVRFPSDGPMKDLDLRWVQTTKEDALESFFINLRDSLGDIPLSADVFGLTLSSDSVGVGQIITKIAPHVDALAPMVYPSHFWNGTYGISVPAAEPYTVIHTSLSDGIARLHSIGIPKEKIRPWFQDFDLVGIAYDAEKVTAQIKAARDLGITSWMMWDPRNEYTKEVYLEPEVGFEPTTTRLQNGSSTN